MKEIKTQIIVKEILAGELYRMLLSELGYQNSTYHLISDFDGLAPDTDFVILNYGFDKSGVEVAKRIREKSNVPILFIHSDEIAQKELDKIGNAFFQYKNPVFSDFKKSVEEALKQ